MDKSTVLQSPLKAVRKIGIYSDFLLFIRDVRPTLTSHDEVTSCILSTIFNDKPLTKNLAGKREEELFIQRRI